MARLQTIGFEENSVTNGVELNVSSSAPSIQSTTKRTGTYALEITSLASGTPKGVNIQYASTGQNGPLFFRFYFRYHTLPSVSTTIAGINTTGGFGSFPDDLAIALNSDGSLKLYDTSGSQIGSNSSTLSADTWYRIEMKYDFTGGSGHYIISAQIDGSVFASVSTGTQAITSSDKALILGGNLGSETTTTGDWFFDDVAINDSTGSSQTSYPGGGSVIVLRPNAAGDVNTFGTQTGGTAGAANNYGRVNEVTPDDATTFNGSSTLNQEDLFTVGDGFALRFDGSQNYVLAKSGRILSGLTNWYIKIYFRTIVSGAQSKSLYCERASTGNDILKVDYINPSLGEIGLTYRDDAGTLNQIYTTGGKNYSDGKLHYIEIIKTGTAVVINTDLESTSGTLTATNTFTDASVESRIASDKGDTGAWLAATIDNIVGGSSSSSLLFSYNFNDGSGTTATDGSGSGNNGTLSGSPVPVWDPGLSETYIGSSDTINVVHVSMRYRNSTADATATIKAEIEKAASGTILQSSGFVPNSTTWKTNNGSTFLPAITSYKDPDNVNAWTKTTLDSMQAGYKLTTGPGTSGRRIDVTALWVTVDYTPVIQTTSVKMQAMKGWSFPI